jgi:hypothetical protein
MTMQEPPTAQGAELPVTGTAPPLAHTMLQVFEVRGLGAGLQCPRTCACCGQQATRTEAQSHLPSQRELLVPYCDDCHAHAGAEATRRLALVLGSGLLTSSLALGVPLVLPWLSLTFHLLLTLCSSLPAIALLLRRRPPRTGHSAPGRAAWWSSDGQVRATSEVWARRLAELNGATPPVVSHGDRLAGLWLSAIVLLPCLVAPAVHRALHPLVRWVNVSAQTLTITLDGHPIVTLEPTSSESPLAGQWVRVPVGRRRLEARSGNGQLIDFEQVELRPLTEHLGLPGGGGHCPWLEVTAYGRAGKGSRIEPLTAGKQLWPLELAVDHWFSPNPPAGGQTAEPSGGEATALRLSPCSQVEPPVRAALGAAGWQFP